MQQREARSAVQRSVGSGRGPGRGALSCRSRRGRRARSGSEAGSKNRNIERCGSHFRDPDLEGRRFPATASTARRRRCVPRVSPDDQDRRHASHPVRGCVAEFPERQLRRPVRAQQLRRVLAGLAVTAPRRSGVDDPRWILGDGAQGAGHPVRTAGGSGRVRGGGAGLLHAAGSAGVARGGPGHFRGCGLVPIAGRCLRLRSDASGGGRLVGRRQPGRIARHGRSGHRSGRRRGVLVGHQ